MSDNQFKHLLVQGRGLKQIKKDIQYFIIKIPISIIFEIWNSDEMLKLRGIHKDGKYWLNESCKKCVNGISGSDLIERPQDLRKIKAPN